jgi:hypothetical protein
VPLKPIRNLLHQRIRAGLTTTRRPEPTSTGGDVVAVLCQARSASSATYSAHRQTRSALPPTPDVLRSRSKRRYGPNPDIQELNVVAAMDSRFDNIAMPF